MKKLSLEEVRELLREHIDWSYDPFGADEREWRGWKRWKIKMKRWWRGIRLGMRFQPYPSFSDNFYSLLIHNGERHLLLEVWWHVKDEEGEVENWFVGVINVPDKLLKRAVRKQDGSLRRGYYLITKEIRDWIRAYASQGQ